ncbi:MAG: oligoendopeptidase F [Defluviitaleaceae bacterium]|nr:oligoendopeptidase F [Defluviitaleaceae bacterium]
MEIKQKKRSEIPSEYKWNLCPLYPTDTDWYKAIETVKANIEALKKFEGTLHTGDAIFACLEKYYAACETESRVYIYANLKRHENANVAEAQSMSDMAERINTVFEEATAFITPEILSHTAEDIYGFINTTPSLKMYAHHLNSLMRKKAHVLTTEMEALLASAGEMAGTPENAYQVLISTELKFGNIVNENGDTVEVTDGRRSALLDSHDRRVRKDTFDTFWGGYNKLKNTFATLFSASIKKDIFFAKARKYETTLDASLHENNIPRAVYENLISTVHEYLPVMYRYIALRKKILGLDALHMYDKSVPLTDEVEMKITYDEAKKMLIEGLAPLGEEYLNDMAHGMESGWIDVYESEGKTNGAFEWAGLGTQPYVLLNYEDNLDGLLGHLAHEMGHAMHDFYTNANQPHVYADHTYFTAEVAATVHETMMMNHLIKYTNDPKTRLYLIDKYIEQFRGTMFRQVMFAEFEMITHRMAEEGEPLVLETINKVYRQLNEKYHGPEMIIDKAADIEWAWIEHFYDAFYVYQYATSFAAAIAFTKHLQSGDPQKRAHYLNFLKAGSSDYPIELLKKAGVDMSTPAPIREALKVFESLVDELEKGFK